MEPQKGFFASLFDISFRSLITTRIVRVVYVLYMIVIALAAIFYVVIAFRASTVLGVVVLIIVAPLFSILYLIVVRVFLEALIAVFRIMENTGAMATAMGATPPSVATQTWTPGGPMPPAGGTTPEPPTQPTG